MKKTLLIRHAQSRSNAGGAAEPVASIPLSSVGVEQAQALASTLVESYLSQMPPTSIWISRYERTLQTAKPLLDRFQEVSPQVGNHHEFTYLPIELCIGLTHQDRARLVTDFWSERDPLFTFGDDAESFDEFANRVVSWDQGLATLPLGIHCVFGHGQFFAALAIHSVIPYNRSWEWMERFRRLETKSPLSNCAVLVRQDWEADELCEAPQIDRFVGPDPNMQKKIRQVALASFPGTIMALRTSLDSSETTTLRKELHTLRPTLAAMFNPALSDLVQDLENSLRSKAELSWSDMMQIGNLIRALQTLAIGGH